MLIYPLNLSQSEAYSSLTTSEQPRILTSELKLIWPLLSNHLIKNQNEGQSSLVLVEDEENAKTLMALFSKIGLDKISYHFHPSENLDTYHSSKLGSNIKSNSLHVRHSIPIEFEKLSEKRRNVVKNFSLISGFKFGTQNLEELIWKLTYGPLGKMSKYLNAVVEASKFEFNYDEFIDIRSNLEQAVIVYKDYFKKFEEQLVLNQDLLDEDRDYEKHQNLIAEWIKNLTQIKLNYVVYFDAYKKQERFKIIEFFQSLNKEIETFEFLKREQVLLTDLESYHSTKNFKTENTELESRLIKQIGLIKNMMLEADFNALDLDILDNPNVTLEEIQATIESLRKTHEKNIEIEIKRLNKYNLEDVSLTKLENELSDLILQINDCQLLKGEIELNTLSTLKKFQGIDTINEILQKAHFQLSRLGEFMAWKERWPKQHTKTNVVISSLNYLPKSKWLEAFEGWYYSKLIENFRHNFAFDNKQLLPDYFKGLNKLQDKISSYIEFQHKLRVHEILEKTKKHKNPLLRTLNKSKLENKFSIQELLTIDASLIGLFPICIIQKTELSALKLVGDKTWDELIIFNTKVDNIQKRMFKKLSKRKSEYKLLQVDEIREQAKIISNDKNSSLLINEDIIQNHSLNKIPLSEKLKSAKSVAQILSRVNQSIRVFYLKDSVIISLLSKLKTESLYNVLHSRGVKEQKMSKNLIPFLTEALLETEKKQFLMIEDGLLNVHLSDCFEWQLSLMDKIKTLGIEIINSDTMEGPSAIQKLDKYFQVETGKAVEQEK